MARKKSAVTELSDRQKKIVDAKMQGASDRAAIDAAGYKTNSVVAARTEAVKIALAEARQEVRNASTLTRLDIIDGLMDAISMARTAADPGAMINGYDKLAKIIGAYEPQIHKIELSENGARLLKKMEAMSREELLAISEGSARIIDGEFVHVDRH